MVIVGTLVPPAAIIAVGAIFGMVHASSWYALRSEPVRMVDVTGGDFSGSMELVDVNADGRVDVVDAYDGVVGVQLPGRTFAGSAPVVPSSLGGNTNIRGAGIGDLDGDGYADRIYVSSVQPPGTGLDPVTTDPATGMPPRVPEAPRPAGIGTWLMMQRGLGNGTWGPPMRVSVQLPERDTRLTNLGDWDDPDGTTWVRLVDVSRFPDGRVANVALLRHAPGETAHPESLDRWIFTVLAPTSDGSLQLIAEHKGWLNYAFDPRLDLTGDDHPDLLAWARGRQLAVDGRTGAGREVPSLPLQDVDGDGDADVVTVDDEGRLRIRERAGGRIGPWRVVPGVRLTREAWVVSGELTGDGIRDLVATTYPSRRGASETWPQRLIVLRGTKSGGFEQIGPRLRTSRSVAVAEVRDADRDGHGDVVFRDQYGGHAIAWGDGTGHFAD